MIPNSVDVSRVGGGDPRIPDARLQVLIDAQTRENEAAAAAAAAAPRPKPGVWSRVAEVFRGQREQARDRYRRLLKKAEVDKKDLSDREVIELAEAMREAGISPEMAEAQRHEIKRQLQYTAAAERIPGLEAIVKTAQAQLAEVEAEMVQLIARRNVVFGQADTAGVNLAATRELGYRADPNALRLLLGE